MSRTHFRVNPHSIVIDNAEDLDIVMPMYNLLQYSKNYRKTTGSRWNYYRHEPNDPITNSTLFKYKNSITGKTIEYNVPRRITAEDGNPEDYPNYDANEIGTKETKLVVPLKYLSNCWRTLILPLINCEASLSLTWSKDCALTDLTTRDDDPNDDPPAAAINAPGNATFKITDCKLYVPVVTLSAENNNKFLEQLKTGFKRTITWNKCKSQMSKQTEKNNLNYLIDPRFTNVNRLFVLLFKNEDEDVRTSFKKYYLRSVEIKDFNVLIDGKQFFEIPAKNKEEAYKQIIEISKNIDYTAGSLLDYVYF